MRFLTILCAVTAAHAGKVEVLRDEYGVPHIFARTPAEAAFASGYVQAEDRLDELMRNLRKADGSMAEVFGRGSGAGDWVKHDGRQRLFGHRYYSAKLYGTIAPEVRKIIEAYVAGIRHYVKTHPGDRPKSLLEVTPQHIVAFSRYSIWRWHEGDASDDLRRGGITPDPQPYLGSNQMLIAPWRTAVKAPIAVVDPHLSWYGETRYYEMRVYAGAYAWSGGARTGLPFPVLGHGRHLSIAMTTGGPDTGDVFEEELEAGKYRFKGEWRPLEIRREVIKVAGEKDIEVKVESTGHGPIWAHKDGKSYSFATPYTDQVKMLEQTWAMVNARNLAEMKKALAMRQYMAQNIMVGTTDGDIFYVRNGRVPVRPEGCDSTKPQPGGGACEWGGLHDFADLVQVANPKAGYMQNNNCPPSAMIKDAPAELRAARYTAHPYLYNVAESPAHQRAAETVEELAAATGVTAEQAIGFAFSTRVYKAEAWQERIRQADPGAAELLAWNRRSDPDSAGALLFYFFKLALGANARAVEPPDSLGDDEIRRAVAESKVKAAGRVFGDYFRVGRAGVSRTYPVGGGGLLNAGMATPRNITFEARDGVMVGVGGQSQTQIVVLSKPVRSWMIIPLGESDHADSPHYDDQAAKLFSKGIAKDTYFDRRRDLEPHVTRRVELRY